MATPQELDAGVTYHPWMVKVPGRLTADRAGEILGFAPHDMPVLVKHRLLTPLGQPAQRSTKYFTAVKGSCYFRSNLIEYRSIAPAPTILGAVRRNSPFPFSSRSVPSLNGLKSFWK